MRNILREFKGRRVIVLRKEGKVPSIDGMLADVDDDGSVCLGNVDVAEIGLVSIVVPADQIIHVMIMPPEPTP